MTKRNNILENKIIELIKEGIYPSKISALLNISTTLVLRHLKYLEKEGKIKSYGKCPKFYKILIKENPNPENPSLCVRKLIHNTTIHDLKIKYSIIKKGIKLKGKTIKVNNWEKTFIPLEGKPNITLELTTNSIIAHVHRFEMPSNMDFISAFSSILHEITAKITLFMNSKGYSINNRTPTIISQHIANDAKDLDNEIANGAVFQINLNHKAKTPLGEMKQEAKAWVDKSGGLAEIETNDTIYEKELLEMPLKMAKMERTTREMMDVLAGLVETNTAQTKALQYLMMK
jgi:hypothetical protein